MILKNLRHELQDVGSFRKKVLIMGLNAWRLVDEPIEFSDEFQREVVDPYLELHQKYIVPILGENGKVKTITNERGVKTNVKPNWSDDESNIYSSLRRQLNDFFEYDESDSSRHASVSAFSTLPFGGFGKGAQNRVGNHGLKFRVIKYEHEDFREGEDAVGRLLYLKRKYELLRLFLPEHIPSSAFFIGERKSGGFNIEDGKIVPRKNRYHIITYQKFVNGKTMKEMSREEREDKTFLDLLKKALIALNNARHEVNECCIREGYLDAIKLNLEIGISSESNPLSIDLSGLNTPNIMYDKDNGRIYFIDFANIGEGDAGQWDLGKERIFWKIKKQIQRNAELGLTHALFNRY